VSRAAVFLDRDGVLNVPVLVDGLPYPPSDESELELLPGVATACAQLSAERLTLIVVTNQPDIARGRQDAAVVDAMNTRLQEELNLDEVVVCPHDDGDECACRKPKPGMLVDAAARWKVDLARSVMVGDRWRDIAAGHAAGTRTVFVDRHYAEPSPEGPDLTVNELQESVSWIIETIARRP
jgi:D-glycero-D-manno-heptose 1,7-bisphosphate phosphatase